MYQHNCESIRQNLGKISSYKGHIVVFAGISNSIFFLEFCPFWLRNLAKMINTLYYWSEIVCQRNSSETFKQNLMKLCSWQGHTIHMQMHIHRKFCLIFFLREQLELWPKYTIWKWLSMNDKEPVLSDIFLTVNV